MFICYNLAALIEMYGSDVRSSLRISVVLLAPIPPIMTRPLELSHLLLLFKQYKHKMIFYYDTFFYPDSVGEHSAMFHFYIQVDRTVSSKFAVAGWMLKIMNL